MNRLHTLTTDELREVIKGAYMLGKTSTPEDIAQVMAIIRKDQPDFAEMIIYTIADFINNPLKDYE